MNRPASNARPVVSFGLPVRNGAPTIGQAIESVLAQTFEDWELVISDNLSTDGTSEICASFAARDERIRHVPSGRDLSIHENFRAAFHHSRGTYFRWYGDDDWLEPPYAERAVAALEGSPEAVLCTTVQQYYRDGQPLPVNDPIPALGGVDSPDAGSPSSHAAPPVPERRAPRDRPRLLTGTAGRRGTDGPARIHSRRGLRVLVRDGAPRAVRPRPGGPGASPIAARVPDRHLEELPPTRAVDRLRRQSVEELDDAIARSRVCRARRRSRRESTRTGFVGAPARSETGTARSLDWQRGWIADARLAKPADVRCAPRRCQTRRRRTSSVTSGRAKNRNGTNVVPVPGETCIVPAASRRRPDTSSRSRVRERDPATREWDADLTGMQMAGEDEVEATSAGPARRSRGKWQSRSRKLRRAVGRLVRPRRASPGRSPGRRRRSTTRTPRSIDGVGVVSEQPRPFEIAGAPRPARTDRA